MQKAKPTVGLPTTKMAGICAGREMEVAFHLVSHEAISRHTPHFRRRPHAHPFPRHLYIYFSLLYRSALNAAVIHHFTHPSTYFRFLFSCATLRILCQHSRGAPIALWGLGSDYGGSCTCILSSALGINTFVFSKCISYPFHWEAILHPALAAGPPSSFTRWLD